MSIYIDVNVDAITMTMMGQCSVTISMSMLADTDGVADGATDDVGQLMV
jgi:hypothetical protein